MRVEPEPTGAYLCELLDRPFTREQLDVATHPMSSLLVVAGAGSGKTAVMAARVVHLVAFHQVPPSRVLGLTFTNKAAAELAERVRTALHALAGWGWEAELLEDDQPTVATYHAYAAALVRDHALRIGREPQSELLTEATRWQLASRVVRTAPGPFGYLTWQPSTVTAKVLALDAELSEHLVPPAAVAAVDTDLVREAEAAPKQVKDVTTAADTARARDELLTLVAAYRARKAALDLIDFGDQVALATQIAERAPEVGAVERERYAAVLLDEYQDTGVAQRRLLCALFKGHPVTAVGDPNQAIYGWRGASVGNLARFPEHFAPAAGATAATGAAVRETAGDAAPPPDLVPTRQLMTSFRCGPRILTVAGALAAPLATSPAAARRPPVDVRPLAPTEDCADDQVRVALLPDVEAEARWVARTIKEALDEHGLTPGAAAVLVRRRTDFSLLHRELVDAGLPVEVVGLGGLLEMPEVADVVATLRVLADPVANPALIRLLTGARWRIGARDLAALGRRAYRLATWLPGGEEAPGRPVDPVAAAAAGVDPSEVVSLIDGLESLGDPAAYSEEAYDRLRALRAELHAIRGKIGQPVVDVVAEVIARTGLDVEIEAQPADLAAARAANLAAFLDHAAHFNGLDGESDLPAFLAYLDAAADAENGLDVGGVSATNTVKLLTVHKAKGLEWPVVAVPGLVEKVFPSEQGRPRWTSRAEVLPYRLRGDAEDLPPDPGWTTAGLKAFKEDCSAESADEERRLGYVAVTRARSLLLLSGYWWGATRQQVCGPSTLLLEARDSGVATEAVWEDAPEDDAANPVRSERDRPVPWPPPPDPDAHAERARAAALVRAAMAGALAAPELTGGAARRAAEWDREAEILTVEARTARAGVRDVPLPARLTASQVVLLGEDPDELARRLARPVPLPPLRASRRGTRFHKWVEELWAQRPLLGDDELPGAADGPALDDEALAELQRRFLSSPYGTRRPHAIEAPFELVVGGRTIRGRIDAVYRDDAGRYDVVDFKTGEVPRDFAAASLQLAVYRLAWAGIAGVDPAEVTAGFLYVRTGLLKRPERLLDAGELAALLSGPAVGAQGALF
ncbi:MAG TPA: ATP-dependent DNA helicase [Frankiaceae bacterium]|nr:ATP-dependent DNA helicase [Frankiaceae bacterium]